MIKQHKLRELNKLPQLHKEVFVLASDAMELLEKFIEAAVAAGVDKDKMLQGVMINGDVSDKNDKPLLYDAILGCVVPYSFVQGSHQYNDLTVFTGNQWNEKWDWDKNKLACLDDAVLADIYDCVKAVVSDE